MDRKERILAYIKSKEYIPLKLDELSAVLDVPSDDIDEFKHIIAELADEGKITKTKRGRYEFSGGKYVSGKLVCSARGNYGFVLRDESDGDDVMIRSRNMNGAIDGDIVLARITEKGSDSDHDEGSVIRISERGNRTIVGVVDREDRRYSTVLADNARIHTPILVPRTRPIAAPLGERVVVSGLEYSPNGKIYGTITKRLGDEESLISCIGGILETNGIKREFDDAAVYESKRISETLTQEQLSGREDLRDMMIFTIDGDDAKDFDDAVSISEADNGNYFLGVHIADVSEYVREGGALDEEAYTRGTSVYLPGMVIPMLPEKLSNGVCSLKPDCDRLTLSVFMEIDKKGKVVDYSIKKTVIRSKERMTYNDVNKILENSDPVLCERYKHLLLPLRQMEKLAQILNEMRRRRGAIGFDFPECRITVGEDFEPLEISRQTRGVSNKMIEAFMLAANETVAQHAYWSQIPIVYRSHEPPSTEDMREFSKFAASFSLAIKGKFDDDNPVKPSSLARLLDEVKGRAEERIVSMTLLRSLTKANYTSVNNGHFGLAASFYCHFTSPIRRYPDLVTHRMIKRSIEGIIPPYADTAQAAANSSEREVNAETAERDTDDLLKASYMSRYIGEEFDATVSSVTGFGMFVELENTIQGLVSFENMADDFYYYDEKANSIKGKRKGRVFTVGDRVKVTAVKADILSRQIDFGI